MGKKLCSPICEKLYEFYECVAVPVHWVTLPKLGGAALWALGPWGATGVG